MPMYDELIKWLRELASIPENCENVESCDQCPKEDICLSFTNERIMGVVTQAADAIEELYLSGNNLVAVVDDMEEDLKKFRWIPVTERLPEEDVDVLVVRKFLGIDGLINPCTYVEIASRLGDEWVADSDEYKCARSKHTDPTHWMPLPQPPKDGDG